MELPGIFLNFFIDIINNKRIIWELTKNDLQKRYIGNYLGFLWAFIQPTVTVLILWFVFQVGFKAVPVANFPFILWLVTGMFPWFFFSDAWNSATASIISNTFLVKKVVFRVSLLPIIQILSAFIISCFFNMLLFIMFAIYGYMPTLYNLQIIYYLFAEICLILGLSLITSSLTVFSKDVVQLVGMFLQLGFWVTPIFWSLELIPNEYQWLLKLNPMYYITNGYRDAFINQRWFWDLGYTNIVFWFITILTVLVGVFIFRKLRPHFADVL